MRILFVSAHYPPDLGACATRVRELCTSWAAEGHEVHVLCGLPNHPTGVIPPEYRGRLVKRELIDGVHVHRTWIYATPNSGTVRRSAAYGSFAASAVLLGQRGIPDPDVLVATSPQFLTALAGAAIARQRGVPLVSEIRDLWPASVWEVGAMPRNHPVIKVLEQVERWLYRESELVVVVSPSFQEAIARATGGRAVDVPVITNGVSLDRFDPDLDATAVKQRFGLPTDVPLAVYAGTHGLSHGLETVLEAAKLAPEVHFVLVGEGARKQALVELGRDLANVTFLPGQPAQAMPEIYAMTDIALVPLRDLPLFRTVIPSKMFEIWAMETPLVLGVAGQAEDIVRASGAGLVVPPEDAAAMAAAVRELAADPDRRREMGRSGRDFVASNYDRKVLARRYLDLLQGVARDARGRARGALSRVRSAVGV